MSADVSRMLDEVGQQLQAYAAMLNWAGHPIGLIGDGPTRQRLTTKRQEYVERLSRHSPASSSALDTIAKIAVVTTALAEDRTGYVTPGEVMAMADQLYGRQIMTILGLSPESSPDDRLIEGRRLIRALYEAVKVIADYAATGGVNVEFGTGLKLGPVGQNG